MATILVLLVDASSWNPCGRCLCVQAPCTPRFPGVSYPGTSQRDPPRVRGPVPEGGTFWSLLCVLCLFLSTPYPHGDSWNALSFLDRGIKGLQRLSIREAWQMQGRTAHWPLGLQACCFRGAESRGLDKDPDLGP